MGWFLWSLSQGQGYHVAHFFKMADNSSDSNTSNSDKTANEGLSNLIAQAKRLGANLRTPEKAKIARERKLQNNPATKSCSTRGQSDPKLSLWQQVQEHKNEYLTSVDGKLRFDACKETISNKKSTVKKHTFIKACKGQEDNFREQEKKPVGARIVTKKWSSKAS